MFDEFRVHPAIKSIAGFIFFMLLELYMDYVYHDLGSFHDSKYLYTLCSEFPYLTPLERRFVMPDRESTKIIELKGIVVPDGATIEGMVDQGGYDYANRFLTSERFVITHRGSLRVYLANFMAGMKTDTVEEAVATLLDKQFALVEGLLAIGSHPKYRGLQHRYTIVCLGSYFDLDGDRFVPCLQKWGDGRCVDIRCRGGWWCPECWFLLSDTQA